MKVSVDASYQLLAAQYVRKQLKQLAGQLDGVRQGEDAEYVHRARVASRRLRAALRMFGECFGRKKVKRWNKEIRRLTDNLGEARDKDVQIQFVCGVLSRLHETEYASGLARLLVKLEHTREKTQPKVLRTVDHLLASPVPGQMRDATKSLISGLGKRGVRIQSEFVFRQAERHIREGLDDMVGYQACLGDPEDQDGHHAMRIAAKRLRYTMEICRPLYGDAIEEFISSVKEVQSLLGEIHDCDVWDEYLQQVLEEERRRIVRYYHHSGPLARLQTGIDYLRADRHDERRQLFEKLVQYWEEVGRIGVWDNLVETIRTRNNLPGQHEAEGEAPAPGDGDRPADPARPVPHKPTSNGGQCGLGTPSPLPNLPAGRSLERTN